MEQSNEPAVSYAIDAGASRLTVRAYATGLLSALGHDPSVTVRELNGEAHLAEGTLKNAALHVAAAAASLTVENNASEKDRNEMQRVMQEEVLETKQFAGITFECSNVTGDSTGEGRFDVVLNGSLTLHGVTCPERIRAQVFVAGNILRASGEFTLRQSAYHIKPVTAVAGALRLKDELTIHFDVVARKQA